MSLVLVSPSEVQRGQRDAAKGVGGDRLSVVHLSPTILLPFPFFQKSNVDKETLQKVLAAIGFDFDKVKDAPQRDEVASTIMDALYKQVEVPLKTPPQQQQLPKRAPLTPQQQQPQQPAPSKSAGSPAPGSRDFTMGQNQVILRHQKFTSRVSGASERTSEWPSTYISILVCSRPQCEICRRREALQGM